MGNHVEFISRDVTTSQNMRTENVGNGRLSPPPYIKKENIYPHICINGVVGLQDCGTGAMHLGKTIWCAKVT